VNQIQPQPGREPRQLSLVPYYIFDGRPVFLGHKNLLEGIAKFFQERLVLLQHEEDEPMLGMEFLNAAEQREKILRNPGFSPLDHRGRYTDFHAGNAANGLFRR
jgi:hypothetical protein